MAFFTESVNVLQALAISISEKARIDMEFMSELTGKTEDEIFDSLKGVIFLNPMHRFGNETAEKYVTADEYLSGNVREKLEWAKRSAKLSPHDYDVNVEALEKAQPEECCLKRKVSIPCKKQAR